MNKNAIKKFAIEARRELISRVGQRALKYGISDKEVGNPNDDSVNGHLLSSTEKKQRAALIEQIKEKGYEQVMEEVAYTWFNRFSALRFMEVNGYLPTRVRVFTDENNTFKPQILTEAIHMELDGLDMEKVYAYKEANDNDELYKYLLITQCNALNSVLPGMFQKIADYTELLFPDNLLREGSVVQQMIELIPEEDWKDAVQIIGWLYQYYNSEKKDDVFAALKKNVKITKENIPAATQLFTPDWIVRYMVENSLGRLWVEGHPNDELKSQWKYYLEEAEQEPDVQAQLATIREEYKALKPEDILCIDPCSGSGHILAYMFDVLIQIYEAYGVDTRTAVASIVENNIYGLDIDDRAAQLAYFSVMMKACQYDKRFLRRKVQPHAYAIMESNHVDRYAVEYFCNGDTKLKAAMDTIIEELHDAKEYGSIITVSQQDWDALYARFEEIQNESVMSIYSDAAISLKELVTVAELLSKKYDVVITNPPYMGSSGGSDKLQKYIKDNYANSKADLYSVFIDRNLMWSKRYISMITMESWMFLASFDELRNRILDTTTIINMVHMPYLGKGGTSLGINFGNAAYIIDRKRLNNYKAVYSCVRYYETNDEGVPFAFPTRNEKYAELEQENFAYVPGRPIGYWLSRVSFDNFKNMDTIGEYIEPRIGLITGDNNRFLRFWHEVNLSNIGFGMRSISDSVESQKRWFPYQKGGEFRRWYGNLDYIVDWKNDGYAMKNDNSDRGRVRSHNYNGDYSFISCITWTSVTTGTFACRFAEKGFLFDAAGPICRVKSADNIYIFLALLSSKVARYYLEVINPTINFHPGYIMSIPFSMSAIEEHKDSIDELARKCVELSKKDWNSSEYSWDFQSHVLIRNTSKISDAYEIWQNESMNRFNQMKAYEEALNKHFIEAYKLQKELTPDVEAKDVTVREAKLEDAIKSFISYAVGCMFGRFSLDSDGITYAGGKWNDSNYHTFNADRDNIIPISDDEYFEDDIVARFVKFVEIVYGKDTLQENLKFIADALGGKGQPKDVIRNYFMNGFYADHCKMYQKRPIYWMFDSGKKNGFKCLIYMHRYQPDTIARIRTDYVHEQQARYRTTIADLETRIANASTSERVKLNKQLKTLNDQAAEIHAYEEKIHHLADQMISIDLDDGVKKNYEIFKDVLAKIK
ncbi:BREX-1 system adenine-specific DNA-methyltransferase PglX [Eubacterium limosum]|uniref:BREX-1 system adenine-specific DNA-methyltransferase PglX n=1 Tax=Eubacterium limosum TaxID=1736 RepID=UPI00106259E0|nr:BREX-1 system adenine-specific DNA-methyltransferase PglX [Eubacterium limosum]